MPTPRKTHELTTLPNGTPGTNERRDAATPFSKATDPLGPIGDRTIIRSQVVARIAGLAVREVAEIKRLAPIDGLRQPAARTGPGPRFAGSDLGVRVDVDRQEVAVAVRIVTDVGYSLPVLSDEIRLNVARRVEAMTGLLVREVDIDVVGLTFGDEEASLPPATVRV